MDGARCQSPAAATAGAGDAAQRCWSWWRAKTKTSARSCQPAALPQRKLRTATAGLVTALGVARVADVLGLAPALVRSLCSPEAPDAVLEGLLRLD